MKLSPTSPPSNWLLRPAADWHAAPRHCSTEASAVKALEDDGGWRAKAPADAMGEDATAARAVLVVEGRGHV